MYVLLSNLLYNRFEFRGFHGDYEVTVKVGGVVQKTEMFTLDKQDTTVNISM